MKLTVLAVSLALACVVGQAEARPKGNLQKMQIAQGCSDPVMRPCEVSRAFRHHPKHLKRLEFQGKRERFVIAHHNAARPRAWCGWWLGRHLGMLDRNLWRALAWRHVGRAAHGPDIGVVVVWARGKGRGHVGIITGRASKGWVVKSGNDGNAIRERVRSVSNAIAFRWP